MAGKRQWRLIIPVAAVFAMIFFCGCRSTAGTADGNDAPPSDGWTLSELENSLGGRDPIEPFNRCMFTCNEVLMEYLVDPIGRIYCTIIPRPLIDMIHNASLNVEYPARVISCLISAEWRGAWDETLRFFANTIIGVGGLFDVAGAWWKIYSTDSDFGQAFAAWGIDPGCTLVLPFCRHNNIRDTVGLIFDAAFDGKTYIPFAGWATAANRMVMAHRSYQQAVYGAADKYKNFRSLSLMYREIMIRKMFYRLLTAGAAAPPPAPLGSHPAPAAPAGITANWCGIAGYHSVSPLMDSLRLLHFAPQKDNDFWYYPLSFFNADFARQGSHRRLRLRPDAPRAYYCFWKAPEEKKEKSGSASVVKKVERLAVILPGIGGLCDGRTTLALAEVLHRSGFAVLTCDSTFSWRQMEATGNQRLPGYLPDDGAQVRFLLEHIFDDLRERGDISAPEITLLGYSMGGMHTLQLASGEQYSGTLKIDRFVAISPPVSLGWAMQQADRFSRAGDLWKPASAIDSLVNVGSSMLSAQAVVKPPFDPEVHDSVNYRLSIRPDEAEFATGIYLKSSLREVLFAAHRGRGLKGVKTPYEWGRRNALYLELDRISLQDYARCFLAADYPGIPLQQLIMRSDLRSLYQPLSREKRVRVLHSYDDPLLSGSDRSFLDLTFGKRLTWFSNGGHLGALYVRSFQQAIVEAAMISPPEPVINAADLTSGTTIRKAE